MLPWKSDNTSTGATVNSSPRSTALLFSPRCHGGYWASVSRSRPLGVEGPGIGGPGIGGAAVGAPGSGAPDGDVLGTGCDDTELTSATVNRTAADEIL